jgi:hypothetical protein
MEFPIFDVQYIKYIDNYTRIQTMPRDPKPHQRYHQRYPGSSIMTPSLLNVGSEDWEAVADPDGVTVAEAFGETED